MTQVTNPAENPELAAQEVLVALVQAGKTGNVLDSGMASELAEGLVKLHEQLAAYYRSMPGAL